MRLNKYNYCKIIPAINIALSCSAVVLFVIVLFSLRKPNYSLSAVDKDQKSEQSGIISGTEPAKNFQVMPDYNEEIFKRKQLFNSSKLKGKETKGQEFILLGVSIGEKNIAMIKDARENKDYYCKEGDKIGSFNVKQIAKDKVILESQGNIMVISQ